MNKIYDVLLNRLVIAITSAAGAFILTQWPTVHDQLCSASGVI